jgi:hypothetical protein
MRLRRTAVAVLVLSTVALWAPASPAQATGSCSAVPSPPGMIDPQLYMMDGPSEAVCPHVVTDLHAEAQLFRYVGAGQWASYATGDRTEANVQYVWADALMSCKGQGPVSFYTQGFTSVFDDTGYSNTAGPVNSGYTTVNCGDPPPVPIHPGQ